MTDTQQSTEAADLATLAEKAGTTFILALFVDLNGKPCAKLVPIEAVHELQNDGVGFAGYAVGAIGQEPKDPDLIAIPDPASFTPVPFIKEGLAIVHCDPHVEGRPWPFAPRVILKSMLAKLAASQGLEACVGAEVEYFLLRRETDGSLVTADPGDSAARPCYDARGVTRMYDHLAAVSCAMNELGWGNYANDHEDGNGQFEQNFSYADALTTADRVVTLRYLITMLAEERGMVATFMPKPFSDRTGTGLHLHLSLWKDGTSAFPDDHDARGLGISPTAYGFVGGILDHASALQAVLGPSVNSYKRTGAVSTTSGASWAPTFPTYGGNDRTHFIRIPDHHRVELRGGDGAANPYLAIAAALGAGLDGIERGADPGSVGGDNGTTRPCLPRTLVHAVEALDADPVVRAALDVAAGAHPDAPEVSAYFSAAKRKEFFDYHARVSAWEIEHYLTAY